MEQHREGFDSKGHFAPGNRLATANRGKAKYGDEVRRAIQEEFPPREVAQMLRNNYEMAVKQKSSRAMATTTGDVLAYAVGKPRQVEAASSNDMPEWLVMVMAKVNEPVQIAGLNDAYIALSDGESGAGEVIEGVIVDTTIAPDDDQATKTPDKRKPDGINVDTTIDRDGWVGG